MHTVEIEITGAKSSQLVEEYLIEGVHGFEIESRSMSGRQQRNWSIGEVMMFVGYASSVAGLAKTVLDIYGILRKSGDDKAVISLRNTQTGEKSEIPQRSAEASIAAILPSRE
jgi:hypothetical protein